MRWRKRGPNMAQIERYAEATATLLRRLRSPHSTCWHACASGTSRIRSCARHTGEQLRLLQVMMMGPFMFNDTTQTVQWVGKVP